MNRVLFVCVVCLAFMVTVGCVTTTTTSPLVYTNSQSTEFEILGTVFLRSSTSVGYNTVFEEAKKQFPTTDYVIDIMIDQHEITTTQHFFVHYFLSLFRPSTGRQQTRYEYTIRGTAISYIRRNAEGEIIAAPTPSVSSAVTPQLFIPGLSTSPSASSARTGSSVPSTLVAGQYRVESVSGQVFRINNAGNFVRVRRGDIIQGTTVIRMDAISALDITDKNGLINIRGFSNQGNLYYFITNFGRQQ